MAAFSAVEPVQFQDTDGDAVSIKLAGPGSGTIELVNKALQIELTGTTVKSKLTVRSTGGAAVTLTKLNVEDLKSFKAPTVLASHAEITGRYLGDLSLASMDETRLRAQSVRSLKLSGSMKSSRIRLVPDDDMLGLGKLLINGAMENSNVDALADIGTVRVGGMFSSAIIAGVRYKQDDAGTFVQFLPLDEKKDFTGTYAIGNVKITGAAQQRWRDSSFIDSRIAAYNLGDVRLTDAIEHNNGRELGVAGYSVGKITAPYNHYDLVIRQISDPIMYDRRTGTYKEYDPGEIGRLIIEGRFYNPPPYRSTVDVPDSGLVVAKVFEPDLGVTEIVLLPNRTYVTRGANNGPVESLATALVGSTEHLGGGRRGAFRSESGAHDWSVTFYGLPHGGTSTFLHAGAKVETDDGQSWTLPTTGELWAMVRDHLERH